MSAAFELYGQYYDLLYEDKDYAAEEAYVAAKLEALHAGPKRILEFGCGTGGHAELLAQRGYDVVGVERSEAMYRRAVDRAGQLNAQELDGSFQPVHQDARSYRSPRPFDAVISLFHVVSYQTEQSAVREFFASAARHLESGGLFIFDIWYGPAVLTQRPEVRVKRIGNDQLEIVRLAEPTLRYAENVVDVDYQIFARTSGSTAWHTFCERHSMRYFFSTEISEFAQRAGMLVVESEQWLTGAPLSDRSWGACFTLRKP